MIFDIAPFPPIMFKGAFIAHIVNYNSPSNIVRLDALFFQSVLGPDDTRDEGLTYSHLQCAR